MSLLRYPGGKSRGALNKLIVGHILRTFTGGVFAEPFFGGGGITISLLKQGALTHLVLCEKDSALASLWSDVVNAGTGLKRAIKRFQPSVSAFTRSKARVLAGKGSGFDALVVNRLSHGGRGVKAGPQGGYDQDGTYKIGCRWNAAKLVKQIESLGQLFSSVDVAIHESYKQAVADYYYMDPPYWGVGDGLYMHNFTASDHEELFRFLCERRNWLLSYNNHDKVHQLYQDFNIDTTGTSGNGGHKPNSEVLIYP